MFYSVLFFFHRVQLCKTRYLQLARIALCTISTKACVKMQRRTLWGHIIQRFIISWALQKNKFTTLCHCEYHKLCKSHIKAVKCLHKTLLKYKKETIVFRRSANVGFSCPLKPSITSQYKRLNEVKFFRWLPWVKEWRSSIKNTNVKTITRCFSKITLNWLSCLYYFLNFIFYFVIILYN